MADRGILRVVDCELVAMVVAVTDAIIAPGMVEAGVDPLDTPAVASPPISTIRRDVGQVAMMAVRKTSTNRFMVLHDGGRRFVGFCVHFSVVAAPCDVAVVPWKTRYRRGCTYRTMYIPLHT